MAYAEKQFKTSKGVKTKAFNWRVRYRKPDGTWGSEAGFPSKRTAETWGEEQEAAIRSGRWIDPDLTRKQFGTWAREWMRAKSPRGRTVDTRWRRLNEVILPKWEHTPLIEFTWFDVESWANALEVDETTVNHCVSLMSSILTGAVDAKHLLVNPLYGRRRTGKSGRSNSVPAARGAEELWARPEVVLQLADRLGPAVGLHVLATAFTGMRWGEGIGLQREDALRIRRQAHGGDVFTCPVLRVRQEIAEYEDRDEVGARLGTVLRVEQPKNETSVRDIDLPPFLARLMRYHLQDWPHDFVFCTASGTWWRRGNWGKQLRPAADGRPEVEARQGRAARAKWEPIMPGLTMRMLRHTHDTYQAQIGVRPVLAYEQAGHKMSGIKGVYQHPTPAMRAERLDGLQAIYDGAMANLGWRTLWNRVDLLKIS